MSLLEVIERVDKECIRVFMRTANQVAENKLYFDKTFLKHFDVREESFNFTRQYLDKDFLFLQGDSDFRLYVNDVFGRKALGYFEDAFGEIKVDLEHGLLFYYNLKAQQHPELEKALGLVYYLLGKQLHEEFSAISKLAPKNRISPIFELQAQFFRWKRCNYVLRKYMLPMGHIEGYKSYYFEKAHLAQILYLVHHGMTFVEAEQKVKSMEGGLFLPNVPTRIENILMPTILSGGFSEQNLTGYYGTTLVRDNTELAQSYTIDEVYNVYNMAVKPRMIEHTGRVLDLITKEFEQNTDFSTSDFMINHISPQRIGVIVKDTLELKDVLPNLHQYFKPVEPLDLTNVLEGEFL